METDLSSRILLSKSRDDHYDSVGNIFILIEIVVVLVLVEVFVEE